MAQEKAKKRRSINSQNDLRRDPGWRPSGLLQRSQDGGQPRHQSLRGWPRSASGAGTVLWEVNESKLLIETWLGQSVDGFMPNWTSWYEPCNDIGIVPLCMACAVGTASTDHDHINTQATRTLMYCDMEVRKKIKHVWKVIFHGFPVGSGHVRLPHSFWAVSWASHGEAMNTLRQELVDDGWLDPSGGAEDHIFPRCVRYPLVN